MRIGVQIQHELRQRAVHARQLAAQHCEARAAELGGSFAIQPTVTRTKFNVILHLKIEAAWRAPAVLFDIAGFVLARRHRFVRQIRNPRRDGLNRLLDLIQPRLAGFQLIAEARNLSHHRRYILALGLEHADLFGLGIAQVLQLLRAHLQLLALGFPLLQHGDIEVVTAGLLEAVGQDFGLIAQQDGIKHGGIAKRDGTRIIARNTI